MIWSTEIILFSTLPRGCFGKYCPWDCIYRYVPLSEYQEYPKILARKRLGPWEISRSSGGCIYSAVYGYSILLLHVYFPISVNTAKNSLLWFNCLHISTRWSSSLLKLFWYIIDRLKAEMKYTIRWATLSRSWNTTVTTQGNIFTGVPSLWVSCTKTIKNCILHHIKQINKIKSQSPTPSALFPALTNPHPQYHLPQSIQSHIPSTTTSKCRIRDVTKKSG